MKCFIGFPVTIEGYVLNYLKMPFYCKALVIEGFIIFVFLVFDENCVTKMQILLYYQPQKCLSMMLGRSLLVYDISVYIYEGIPTPGLFS